MDDSNKRKMSWSRGFWRVIATLVVTAVGIFAGVQLWQRYMLTPWTRDGRVLANSVTIASEVSGRIVDIRVRENQSVKKGEILFIIDHSTYKAALDNAEASVASNRATMDMQQSNAARGHNLTKLSISAQQLEDLDLQAKSAEANYQRALAVRENAKINLDRTTVYAPVNGYVTNLVVDEGDFAAAGTAVLAVVDSDSFRVEAYLEETKLNFVKVGDSAMVILMSGAPAIKGRVDSIARGIGDTENPVGQNLLQNVNATFEWVRLAQRIPVRIKLVDVPNETILSSGMTATVRIEPKHESEKEPHLVFSESRTGRQ
jgi:multidrug resistance efflux pump